MAMCRAAVRFQAGRMPAGGVGALHEDKECKAAPRCLTCADRGEKDVAHSSGIDSCSVFRAEFRRLRGGK